MNRFTLIILVTVSFLSLNSCIDFPESCGMSYEYMEYELWRLEMDSFSYSNIYKWDSDDSYGGYSTHYRLYGISPNERFLYYTDDYMSRNINLYEMDLNSASVSHTQIDTTERYYKLSPSGKLIAYQKNSTVWISDVEGVNKKPIPELEYSEFIDSPEWFLDDQRLVVNVTGTNGVRGLWVVNLIDSTYKKITDEMSTEYDISSDGSKIVIQYHEPLEYPLIRFKPTFSGNLMTLSEGSSPKFISQAEAVVFELIDGIYMSSLNGETKKIFTKTGGGDRSRNRQVAVSLDQKILGYSDQEGLHIYDTVSEELLFTLENSEFIPSDWESWDHIEVDVSELTFSAKNKAIYFVVERNFYSDGCK